ncbi:MAG: hypothetical protein ACWA6X_09240 [Bauldia sp.]
MTPLIVTKVRRFTMRLRKPGEAATAAGESDASALAGRRDGSPARAGWKPPRRDRRKTSEILFRRDTPAAAAPADAIERLVAEVRERVLVMARKTGGGLAQATVLGRLSATGEISRRQLEAGRRYAAIVREHDALLGRATGSAETPDGADDHPAARSHYRAAMARYDRCRAALRDAAREDRMAGAVVDAVAVNDWSLPDLTPALRIGLNHLARTLDAMGEAPADTGWLAAQG